MSTLTLVRHGQASPFQRESDKLSETGARQARKLAAFWIERGARFDAAYTGTLTRQVETESILADGLRGTHWPTVEKDAAWNEYDATGVLTRLVPAIAAADPSYKALVDAFEQARGTPDQNRRFQPMFERAMTAWLEGATAEGVEPWNQFRDRVTDAIRRLMAGPAGRRVVVFTSGGPIGFCVQYALGAPDRAFLDVNWRIRNCSITEFVYSKDRFSLDSFNGLPHLQDVELWTYR